ncbi:glyoxalase/bleomycin resistance/extradiol dioxygenase family protein [Luteolibacter ambystomatis]|uniref:Glyoxalase/bleomycin resistance/extradiol dioxygenase family protein n=1 Tax=Luteolibacter ambystomatis TaxID=2824561 RepID=A0A975PGT3_9BACT|nr:VOC family protein [Luteolibacter ambystomatis]QUE52900.1 glyoxalase/bleomycin resistance/extradiol dioxygenase family protein [Luteolibacter ambystomatis]
MSTNTSAAATPSPITTSQMCVSLPVKNLPASIAFFKALGFAFNPDFASENGACVVLGTNYQAMLVDHQMFRSLAPRDIADTSKVCEMLIALQLDSRDQVDEIVRRAVAAGGAAHEEAQDHGFMYDHGFTDLDGHGWGVFHVYGASCQSA